MNQAMTCSFVAHVRAHNVGGVAPTNGIISCMYRRETRSSSVRDNLAGSTVTPPFAPPYGKLESAHFQLNPHG